MISEAKDVVRSLKARLREERRERIQELAPAIREALILVPRWNEDLAHQAPGFRVPPDRLDELIEELSDGDIISVTRGRHGREFWMEGAALAEAVDVVRSQGGELKLPAGLAEPILALERETPGLVPPVTLRWAELVQRIKHAPPDVPFDIQRVVTRLLAENRAGEALDLIEASDRLAQVTGGAIVTDIRFARYSVDRYYREKQDQRHLTHFMLRREQEEALDELIEGPDDRWALHYLGVGGVGKTMLIRHILGVAAPERRIPAARVDFDYLKATFPARDPGQLIAALAQELMPQLQAETAERSLLAVNDVVRILRERVAATGAPAHPLAHLDHPDFKRLLSSFSSLIGSLGRRVLLVLDTCEELTKIEAAGGMIPAVEATFRIITEIHDRNPSLRVVFAGRRLLAREGLDWQVDPSRVSAGAAPIQGQRTFLRLHEIRGFTREEAVTYVTRRFAEDERGRALLGDILAVSPEAGRAAHVVYDPPRPATADPRFNPFDLALYSDWVASDPSVDAETLRGGDVDPYVEGRIVRRVESLRSALPAIALLRRFDEPMLRAALGDESSGTHAVLADLASQEWIEIHPRDSNHLPFYQVQRPLQPRLARWAEKHAAAAVVSARESAAATLAKTVRTIPIQDLDTAHLDAALRCSTIDGAVAVWRSFEDRVARASEWDLAFKVSRDLMGDGGAAEDEESELWAWVRATYASCLARTQPGTDLGATWRLIRETLRRLDGDDALGTMAVATPDHRRRRLLVLRATLLEIAALASATAMTEDQARDAWEEILAIGPSLAKSPEAVAACIAALEALVENEERTGWGVFPDPSDLPDLDEQVPVALRAFMKVLQGRMAVLRSDEPLAEEYLRDAARLARTATGQAFVDWRGPSDPSRRIALELARARFYGRGADLDELSDSRALGGGGIDDERLESALLERILHERFPPKSMIETFLRGLREEVPAPTCNAHRRFAPYRATIARAYLATGDVDSALAHAAKLPYPSNHLVTAEIVRRMRLDPVVHGMRTLLLDRDPAVKVAAAAALFVGTDAPDRAEWESALASLPFTTRWSMSLDTAGEQMFRIVALGQQFAGLLEKTLDGERDSIEHARIVLFLREVELLSRHTPEPVEETPRSLRGPRTHAVVPDRRFDHARVRLLEWALSDGNAKLDILRDMPRARAQLAMEEGELLATRLPDRGLSLLDLAAADFGEAKDWVGQCLARVRAAMACMHAGKLEGEEWSKRMDRISESIRNARTDHGIDIDFMKAPWEGWGKRFALVASQMMQPTMEGPRAIEAWRGTFGRPAARRPRRTVGRWFAESWRGIATVGIGVAWLVGLVFAFIAYQRWLGGILSRHFSGFIAGTAPAIILVAVMLLLSKVKEIGSISVDIGGVLSFWRTRKGSAAIEVRSDTPDEVRLSLRWRVLGGGARTHTRAFPLPDEGEEYVKVAGRLDEEIRNEMQRTTSMFRGWYVPVAVRTTDALAPHPWEGYLSKLVPGAWGLSTYRSVVRAPREQGASRDNPFVLFAPPSIHDDLMKTWGHEPYQVAHLVGRPIETTSGVRIDPGDAGFSRNDDGPRQRDPSWFLAGRRVLLILQGSPVAEGEIPADRRKKSHSDESRTAEVRVEASLLRRAAVAAIDRGQEAVLVIPPLSRAHALVVVQILASRIGKQPRLAKKDLIRITNAVRARLVHLGLPDRKQAWHVPTEAALDVTLFLREDPQSEGKEGSWGSGTR